MATNYEPELGEWEDRAEFLEEHTWLAKRQSEVIAMREAGYTRDQIATELGNLSGNTVDTHSQEARKKFKKSVKTFKILKDNFSEEDVEEALNDLSTAERRDLEDALEN